MRNLFLLVLVLFAAALRADEKSDVDHIREVMSQVVEGRVPDSVKPSPMPGVYEVGYGSQFFFISADGRYVIGGDMIDLEQKVNLTEQRRTEVHLKAVNKLKGTIEKLSKDAIIYSPNGKPKHTITVFTDVDCGYCRKLHSGMKEMNDLGIEVRYLAFPRAGVGSASFKKSVSVWCASDPKKAMDLAKAGAEPKPAKCENTVAQQYALGEALGVQGTPAILLEDGRIIPGYVPPQKLAEILDSK